MDDRQTLDELFRSAVPAIDIGNVEQLKQQFTEHPELASQRLETPGPWLRDKVGGALDTFFQRPYLLWFVAEDPVRNGALPPNIADVARVIVEAAQSADPHCLQEQLDYALRLVAWSWIARECNVQIALLDVLIAAGASLGGSADDALINGHFAAAAHLVERGAPLTLAAALCLERWEDARRLARSASAQQKQFALVLASLRGQVEALRRVIEAGADVNRVSADLYSHATALHHAVHSGSLDAVRVLVEAGADLDARDAVYHGTALQWAEQSRGKAPYDEIAAYLRRGGGRIAFETRRADPSDAEDIAAAHRDSIRSLGPAFYPPGVVNDWAHGLTGRLYIDAMERGEVFFIATAEINGTRTVLGFASDYARKGSQHGTSVYVRGAAARQRIGSTLLDLAEAEAIAKGAGSIHVEASLAGVEFYRAKGFFELSRGETHLSSGRPIACVFMQKTLATTS